MTNIELIVVIIKLLIFILKIAVSLIIASLFILMIQKIIYIHYINNDIIQMIILGLLHISYILLLYTMMLNL